MTCSVYEIWIGERFYQGSTNDVAIRMAAHRYELRAGKHTNPIMQNAWNKYQTFEWQILYECEDRDTALAHEQACLDINVDDPQCMNIARQASSGMAGRRHTDATKEKLRQANLGKRMSAKSRSKVSRALRKRTRKPETGRRISAALKARGIRPGAEALRRSRETNTGRPLSDEHRRKLSEIKGGIPKPKVTCPHCGKVGGAPVMARWHFDNCKHKEVT